MTTDKRFTRDDLEALDLTELRRLFVQVTEKGPGIRKPETLIMGILAAQAEAEADNSADDQEAVDSAMDSADPEVAAAATEPEAEPKPTAESQTPIRVRVIGTGSMEGSVLVCDLARLTSLLADVVVMGSTIRFRVSDGEPTRTRKAWGNGGWRLDTSTLPEVPEPSIDDESVSASAFSVPQLQEIYQRLTQRETRSTNRNYLMWKIRQAKAGKIPTGGPRRRASGEKMKTLPLCLPVSTVTALDQAWKRLEYPSRISFLRDAIERLLKDKGEDEVAELVRR